VDGEEINGTEAATSPTPHMTSETQECFTLARWRAAGGHGTTGAATWIE
jgi:hypothetical protein